MAMFGGRRMFRPASGANAGRGDNAHFKPVPMGSVPPPRPGTPGAVGGPPAPPAPRLTIGGTGGATSEPGKVAKNRAARKANSPRTKAKALKKIAPLEVPSGDMGSRAFKPTSEAGFVKSDPAFAYGQAREAEGRIAEAEKKEPWDRGQYNVRGPEKIKKFGSSYEMVDNPDQRSPMERDQDKVSAYVATGKGEYTPEGQAHLEKTGTEAKRKKLRPYG